MTERVFRSSPALRANYRAVRVRRRIRAGRGTDDDRAWLAEYERKSRFRRIPQRERPTVAPAAILAATSTVYHVSIAAMQSPGRGTLSVVRARQIAALALLQTGSSRKTVGVMLHRSASGAHALVDRALAQPALVDEARSVMIAARGAAAGDVVLVPIVVGSAAWCYLDRMAELDEISAVVIRQRIGRTVVDHAVGAE